MITYSITTDAEKTADYFEKLYTVTPARVSSTMLSQSRQLQGLIKTLAPYRTGRLRNSFVMSQYISGFDYTHVEISSDLDYAYLVEYGSANRVPRPYFRPAVNQFEPIFIAALRACLFKD